MSHSLLRNCQCFLCGVEGGKHKKCHGYTIEKTDSSVPEYLFDPIWPTESAWRYHEELKLVGALETYGYGNWSEIASCVTDRTPIECKTHYDRFYITGLIGACTTATHNHLCYRVFDHTDSESNLQLPHSPHISPDGQSALGYMPCRDEFEYEFMNNAESVITAIPFGNISDELYRG
ncbi:hypothetical protein D915_011170 [Fasciola hepatica]|uniref:Uncharacterized protein n=1 Tax=Fasciola hepatica TaxID=6192 RepID=A0A2H1BSA2_FASHE|nr:hypothetical protein D915_011170 [Fasciola hepatica]